MAKLGDVIRPAKVIRCNDNQYPILSMTMHDGIILQSSRFKKNLASVDQSNYKVVNYGQLVIGFPIDEGVLYIQKIVEKGIMSPAYNVWDVNYEIVDPDYLEFCLHSPQSMQYYKENLRGTTARRRSIPTDTLLKLPIYLPSLGEQRKIAMVLNQINNLIAKRQAQLDKLDLLVKARFVEMFGDPVSNPKGWPKVALSDLADVRIGPFGSLLHKEDYIEGGCPLVNPSHIVEGKIVVDKKFTIPKDKYEEMEPYHLKIGDVVMGRRGEMGRCAVVWDSGLLCGTGSLIIRPKSDVTADYIQKIISFPSFKRTIEDMAVGQTMPNLNVPIVSSFQIIKPPVEIQKKYYELVERVEKIRSSTKDGLNRLETLKKALMQDCFG